MYYNNFSKQTQKVLMNMAEQPTQTRINDVEDELVTVEIGC